MFQICDEDIVIAGISCRMPESDNAEEFWQHLIQGNDMVTEDDRRWPPGIYGLPKRNGKLKDIEHFDAIFFGVHAKQCNTMDPQLRILLEVTYEAIVDGGINPIDVRGRKWGVFVGQSASEAMQAYQSNPDTQIGYSMTGCNCCMLSNRLSYYFNFNGPSISMDTACSSSLIAFDQAIRAIKTGVCEGAIVGGLGLDVKPHTSLEFMKLGMLSPEGACKSFDISGNGYCRSEGIVSLLLLKKSQAKRNYATVIHSKSASDGFKQQGITFPNGAAQSLLLQQVYQEARIDPQKEVNYVEAHGTGTKAGDPQEVNAIASVFIGEDRQNKPLLIGSVKSNMGHCEAASGLAGVVKVILSAQYGILPPNLHFNQPNPDIPGLLDGSIKVVTEPTTFPDGYVGINSFGFGGAIAHLLLKPDVYRQDIDRSKYQELSLILCSGRTRESVQRLIHLGHKNTDNPYLINLINSISATPISNNYHPMRGFALLNSQESIQDIDLTVSDKRPVWWIFSGMGANWNKMGQNMMKFPVFKNTITRAHEILMPTGLDLMNILFSEDPNVYDNVRDAFIGLVAVQIALIDCLRACGIEYDGLIGHSVGEIACGYADGALTAKSALQIAYWRGRSILDAKVDSGAMAVVGLSWEEAKQRCLPGVVAACHNAERAITISGDPNQIDVMITELQSQEIFTRRVNSSGIAFHSPYIAKGASLFKSALKKILKTPKLRSSRWITTSVPKSEINDEYAMYASAKYYHNNFINPVLFYEAMKAIPDNAIVIEISPHHILQAVIKRNLTSNSLVLKTMRKHHSDNRELFLNSLGQLYLQGINIDPSPLLPKISYPVPAGTPSIAPAITWDHSQTWAIPTLDMFYLKSNQNSSSAITFDIDLSANSPDHYILGHVIDNRVIYPFVGYLLLAWKALARLLGSTYTRLPVIFKDVEIHQATLLPSTGIVKFNVDIKVKTGKFEIEHSNNIIVTGEIKEAEENIAVSQLSPIDHKEKLRLSNEDVYKELRVRGYDYSLGFRSIHDASRDGTSGQIIWEGNWVTFLDAMLQMSVVGLSGRSLPLPTRIRYISINPTKQTYYLQEDEIDSPNNDEMQEEVTNSHHQLVQYILNPHTNVRVLGNIVEMRGVNITIAPRRQDDPDGLTLAEYHFIPYFEQQTMHNNEMLVQYKSHLQDFIQNNCNQISQQSQNNLNENSIVKKLTQLLDSNTQIDHDLDNDKIEQYLENNNYSLFQLLYKVYQVKSDIETTHLVEDIVSDSINLLRYDILLSALISPRYLRTSIDIVYENMFTSPIRIVELNAVYGQLFRSVIHSILWHPQSSVAYTALVRHTEHQTKLEGEVKAFSNIARIMLFNKDVINDQMKKSTDLLLSSYTTLYENISAEDQISLAATLLSDGGFFILHECTRNFAIVLALFGYNKNIWTDSRPNGHRLLTESEWIAILEKSGFQIVSVKSDGLLSTLFICRYRNVENIQSSSMLLDINSIQFDWVEILKEMMADNRKQKQNKKIWIIADSNNTSGVIGFMNCLRKEPGGENVRCIFNASLEDSNSSINIISEMEKIQQHDLIINVYRDDRWGSFRHLYISQQQTLSTSHPHAYINMDIRGDLSSLKWFTSSISYTRPNNDDDDDYDEVLYHIYYAPINYRDVMIATGKLALDALPANVSTQERILGIEYSGKDDQGRCVMGLLPCNGMATTIVTKKIWSWFVPDKWSLQQAATIPIAYSTAYYALVLRGQIKCGESVLIHIGASNVGQAAIRIALSKECRVFTTVGTEEKRQFLLQQFPQLCNENIGNSRDTSFEEMVMNATNGHGVDIVLNSLSGEKLHTSIRVLADHGRFLEIGKYDLSKNTSLGMAIFLRNISFHGILLDALLKDDNPEWPQVAKLVSDGIASGIVQPLKTIVFDRDDLESAFRFVAQGRHIGKVLIRIRDNENDSIDKSINLASRVRFNCIADKSYIITGGLGGFGLELAQWLIDRGACKLVLTTTTGVRNNYQAGKISTWKDKDRVEVLIYKCNLALEESVEDLIFVANQLGPIDGIFHLAGVFDDGLFEIQSQESFHKVAKAKIEGTKHLDTISRIQCTTLQWFVTFSSYVSVRGNIGQTNYGYANSAMERLCEKRHYDQLPATSIQWGAIGDTGMVFDRLIGDNNTQIGGMLPQRIISCLKVMETLLFNKHPVVSTFIQANRGNNFSSDNQISSFDLLNSIGNILGVKDFTTINENSSLSDLGLDSLMGVEIRLLMERDCKLSMSIDEVRQLTINKLKEISSSLTSNDHSANNIESRLQTITAMQFDGFPIKAPLHYDTLISLNTVTSKDRPMYMFHPIEGSVQRFTDIASKLAIPVYGIQLSPEAPMDNTEILARFYLDKIREKQEKGPYRLCGYSYGCMIAYELAIQLQRESNDNVEVLFMIEGSYCSTSDRLKIYRERYRKELTDDNVYYSEMLFYFIQAYISNIYHDTLVDELISLTSLEQKIIHIVSLIMKEHPNSERKFLTWVTNSFINLNKIAYDYVPSSKFDGDIYMITASDRDEIAMALGNDYGQQVQCDGKVYNKMIESNHVSILHDENSVNIASYITSKLG